MTTRTAVAVSALLVLAGMAHAQQAPSTDKPNPSAATSTGTSTSQSEMNRGVPAVNVDVGRNASNGVVSGSVDRNTDTRNVTGNRADGTTNDPSSAGSTTRPARADRG